MALQTFFPRIDLIFVYNRKSWTEKHYLITSSTTLSPSDIFVQAQGLIGARVLMLGANAVLKWVRCSIEGQYRVFEVLNGPVPSTNNGVSYYGPSMPLVSADANVALLVEADDPSAQYHTRWWISGIPYGQLPETAGGQPKITDYWRSLFYAYRDQLLARFGFRVRDQSATNARLKIQSVTFGLDSVTVALQPGQVGNLPLVGQLARLSRVVSNMPGGCNGLWTVTAASAGPPQSVTLHVPGALAAYSAKPLQGSVHQIAYGVVPYATGELTAQGSKKRGVGYDPPRGRSRPKKASV